MDREARIESALSALESNPHDLTPLKRVEHRVVSDWPSFVDELEARAERTDDPEAAGRLLLEAGRLATTQLDDVDRAGELIRRSREVEETEALAPETRLFELGLEEAYEELIGHFEEAFERADEPADQSRLYLQIGCIFEGQVGDLSQAAESYRYSEQLGPDALPALWARQELARRREEWNELAEMLDREIEAHRSRAADRAEENEDASLDAATVFPEDRADEIPGADAVDRGERTYTESEVDRLAELSAQLGEVAGRRLDDPERALGALERAARLRPEREDVRHELARYFDQERWAERAALSLVPLLEIRGDWSSLQSALTVSAEGASGEEAAELWRRAGDVRRRHLGEDEAALEAYAESLSAAPHREDLHRPLVRTAEAADAWERAADVLGAIASDVDDELRTTYLARLGSIAEGRLDASDRAESYYRQLLEIRPCDAEAFERLERLLARGQEWEPLVDLLEEHIEAAEDAETVRELRLRAAGVCAERLDAPTRAVGFIEEQGDGAPEDRESLRALEELYAEAGRWRDVVETGERRLERVDEETGQAIRRRLAGVYTDELEEPQAAVEHLESLLEAHPGDAEAVDRLRGLQGIDGAPEERIAQLLEAVSEVRGEAEETIESLEEEVEATDESGESVDRLHRIAGLYEDELGDAEAAFEAYVRALGEEPADEETLDEVARLADALDGWDRLVEVLADLAEERDDSEIVGELNRRIGRILDDHLDRPGEAIERYEACRDAATDAGGATDALERLYEEQQRWAELAEVLREQIDDAGETEESIRLRSRLALLEEEGLDRTGPAIDLYASILEDAPDREFPVEQLEGMFADGRAPERIASILESHYVEHGEHRRLIELLDRRVDQLEDRGDRVDSLHRMAEIELEGLDNPPGAVSTYGRALAERPSDEEIVGRIEELAAEFDAWESAVGAYLDALESGAPDDSTAARLWKRSARILAEELDRGGDAEGAYLQALERRPGDLEVLEALEAHYRQREAWGELVDLLRGRIEQTSDGEKSVELPLRLAEALRRAEDGLEEAAAAYREVLVLDPEHDEALSGLERIHRERGEWADVHEVLERRVEAADDPESRVDLYSEIAEVAQQRLDRPSEAVDLWRDVLEIEPENRTALKALEELYIDLERWEALVEILEREIELVDEGRVRAELNRVLGTISGEKLGDDDRALEAWNDVLEVDERDLRALRALREIYRRREAYGELADVLERLVDTEGVDQQEEVGLWRELGEIREDELDEPERAIDAWEKVLALDASDERALDAVQELYQEEGDWEGAVDSLVDKGERTGGEQDGLGLFVRAGDIAREKLGDEDRAADLYGRALEADPGQLEASRGLEAILRSRDSDQAEEELIELYVERADALEDRPPERLEALRSAAELFEDELDQPESALVTLISAFGPATADDGELRAEIERLAEETGSWDDVVDAWTSTVRSLDETPLAADLHEELGYWSADVLDRPDDAVYHLRRALDIDPDRDELLEALEDLLRGLESWPEVANVVEERIERAADPDEEVDLWRSLGEIYEMRLDEPDEALEAYRQILEVDPTDLLALERLERIYESEERWDDLVDILDQKVDASYDPDEVVEIHARIGEICGERLEMPDRAIAAYDELLEVEPTHRAAVEALEDLYGQRGEWEQLLDVYERRLSALDEPEEQRVTRSKIASIYEDRLDDLEGAVDAYEAILDVEPESEMALRNLERLYDRLDAPADLVETLRRHRDAVGDQDREAALLNDIAAVQRDELGDAAAAVDALEDSLAVDSDQPASAIALAELYEADGDWERAVGRYESLLDELDSDERRAEVHGSLGRIFDQELDDSERAEEHYRRVLDAGLAGGEIRRTLARLYEEQNDWESLVDVYLEAAESTDDLTETARFLARAGEVYREELDDPGAAREQYERALEEDPTSVEAAEPLAEFYIRDDEIERAVPLLDRVVQQYEEREGVEDLELTERHARLAALYEEVAHFERALGHYERAFELAPENVDVLLGLGRVSFEMGEYESAADCFDALQREFADRLESEELLEVCVRSGLTYEELDRLDEARSSYARALGVDDDHEPSLEALVDLDETLENWEEVVEHNQRLIELEEDPESRFAKLSRNGDIYRDHLGHWERAEESYREALAIRPTSVAVLRELLQIYRQTEQWDAAVDILDRLIDQQEDPERESHFCYTAGVLSRDEVGDPERAVEYFDRALDANLEKLEAFEAIDRILTDQKNWKELERAYRRMLHRIDEHEGEVPEGIRFKLWEGLGEIYRSRLGHPKSAIEAFETAADLRPENERIRLILTDLHDQIADNPEEVIAQHRKLIEQEPYRSASYEELYEAYYEQGAFDRAWCFAGALTYLGEADEGQRDFYERYLQAGLSRADRTIGEEGLDELYGPEQDRRINAIMGVLNQGLRDLYADDIREDWGFDPEQDRVNLDSGTFFADQYRYVAETVDIVPVPEVYVDQDRAMGLRNANVHPPSVVAGVDVARARDERELTFRLGKLLGAMRREHYLASIGWPTEFLKMMFTAGMHVTNPDLNIGEQLTEQGRQVATEIQEMPSQMQMELRTQMSEYLERGENPNLSVWKRHVERTTNRIGLLLCGDLRIAGAMVKNEQSPISKATPEEQERELLRFSVSDEYASLRDRLGLSIEK